MNITALLEVHLENSGERSNNISLSATKALIFVVENHFQKLATSFVLTFMCRELFFCNYYKDLLDKLFQEWEAPPLQIVSISSKAMQRIPGTRDLNLILIDSFESLRSTDVISQTADYDYNEYYYIFLQNFDNALNTDLMKIFDYCWENYIINCNVQIQTHTKEILIYTYYPFTPESCGKASLRLINQFKNGTLVNEVLFPKKLLNFHGCPLRAAMWDVPPFVYMTEFSNGSGKIEHGVEGRLVTELAKKLNFAIAIRVPPNKEQRGIVDGNNITGALRMLHDRLADFSVGCFRFSADRVKVATATSSFYQSVQIVCVPIAAHRFSSLEILLYPFAASTWIFFTIIWMLLILMIWLINKYRHLYSQLFADNMLVRTYQNLLLMSLGMSATIMPERIFARLLCINWMFFTLLLRTAYQALFFHMIRTQPTNNFPTNFDYLIAHNYTVVLNYGTYLSLQNTSFISAINLHIINDTKETIAFEYVEERKHEKLLAAGPSAFFSFYKDEFKKVDVFRPLKQNIYSMQITMYLSKHSYLVNQFNEELMKFRATGFTQAWTKMELDYQYIRNHKIMEMAYFQLDDLYALFVILILGHTIAMFIFLLELMTKKLSYSRRKVRLRKRKLFASR